MNIFVLSNDPETCAKYHCDKHVIKMILESAQLLSNAHYYSLSILSNKDIDQHKILSHFYDFPRKNNYGIPNPYKLTHINHPCSIWCRESLANYKWLNKMALFLCKEYTNRYVKTHKCEEILIWLKNNEPNINDIGLTPFKQAMPDKYKDKDPVIAYRNYYLNDKKYFAKWKNGEPDWWKAQSLCESIL